MNNVDIIEIKSDSKKIVGFILQILAVVGLIGVFITSLFISSLKPFIFLAFSINMLCLIYNNIVTLKKKHMSILYLIVAIYTFVIFINGI